MQCRLGLSVFERRAANYLDPCLKGIHLRKFHQFESTKDELETLCKELVDPHVVEVHSEIENS